MTIVASERERQRVEHLVLERPRPTPVIPTRPRGLSKQEWKARKVALRETGATLAPGIEERVALREAWSHKQGTPETHQRIASGRAGSLARLWRSGAIDDVQLNAAVEIAEAHAAIGADVRVKTASLETRVDAFRHGDAFYEALGKVRREIAYTDWRRAIEGPVPAILAMIVGGAEGEPEGYSVVARRFGMSPRRARAMLIAALDLWPVMLGRAYRSVDSATLAAMQAGILA